MAAPSVWGDYFIRCQPEPLSGDWMTARAEQLKEEVHLLFQSCKGAVGTMFLMDAVQHLGIDHYFEEDIESALSKIKDSEFSSSSLHEVSIWFRLLREHGHWVSSDVFNQFKHEDGSFGKDIMDDPRGLLSLYNAAHLLTHGEPTLDEAITFARHQLESMMGSLVSPLAEQVKRALRLPLPRTYKRMEAVHYISEYNHDKDCNTVLLELAKLDFNLLQHLHFKELKDITKWWNELSGYIELNYVRDRVVENYLWSHAVFYEKGFNLARIIGAKINILLTIMDDTFDSHATIEDCRVLTEAIQRWDESAISLLPEYLKKFYAQLLRIMKEFESEMAINGNYDIAFMKKQFQNQFLYYLQEVEWSQQNHKPCFEDLVNLTAMTICFPTVCVCIAVCMGDGIPKEALDWVSSFPDVVMASARIARFMNDITALKRGKSKAEPTSSVEWYIREYGVSEEVAITRIESLIEGEWRTVNQARFGNGAFFPVVQRIIKLTVSLPLFYCDGVDVFTFSQHIQKTLNSLFVTPIPI